MAWSTVTLLMITAALTGCGTRAQHPKPLSAWLSYDPVQKTATITLVPAYDNVYGGFNFNGYAKGEVAVIVPVGRRVVVRCANNGTRRPSLVRDRPGARRDPSRLSARLLAAAHERPCPLAARPASRL